VAKLRDFIQRGYHMGAVVRHQVDLNPFSDKEVLTLDVNYRKGMPVANQVFFGVSGAEITNMP
ncbi:DNA-directed RNA polymerase subunit beta, partial [Klebsiella pneumoniae]